MKKEQKAAIVITAIIVLLLGHRYIKTILAKMGLLSNKLQVYQGALDGGCTPEMAENIVAQARHETADFTSNVFKKLKNAFGMKMPSVRPHPHIKRRGDIVMRAEGTTPYAEYDNAYKSARDLCDWLRYSKIPLNIADATQYATVLKSKGYFGAPLSQYIAALNAWKNKG